jgi:RNA polymerase sigma-70 factor (ECF subfamily)
LQDFDMSEKAAKTLKQANDNAKAQDARETFEQLFDEYYDRVFVYLAFRVSNTQDAEDLTAEVFLKAFANPYNPEIARFSTYVFTIAANMLKNHYRSVAKNRDVFSGEEPDDKIPYMTDLLGELITREEYAGLKKALPALPERQYDVVYRRYYLEQPFREIGEALGISEDNAKKIHKRALEKLKTLNNMYFFNSSRA